jgi:hypothetical protein
MLRTTPARNPRPTWRPARGPVLPEGAPYLLLGIPAAFLLSGFSLQILSYMGWFLTALVHESGHTVSALLMGSAAWPAIRLDGHAAAFHREQSVVLAVLVWAGIAVLAWRLRGRRRLRWVLLVAVALYPAFAFTGAREVLHLSAGHLGELAFATVFLWRARTGGFTKGAAERVLYAGLGLLWVGGNLLLFGSLALSEESRRWYLANGSFGLENDFVRLARLLEISLPAVAAPMVLLSLLPLPVALWIGCGTSASVSPPPSAPRATGRPAPPPPPGPPRRPWRRSRTSPR